LLRLTKHGRGLLLFAAPCTVGVSSANHVTIREEAGTAVATCSSLHK